MLPFGAKVAISHTKDIHYEHLTIIRRRRGDYRGIFTEANLVISYKSFVFWGDRIYFNFVIYLSVTSTKRPAAILQISVLLYSPAGEYLSLIY
jgi:hypothetical protein